MKSENRNRPSNSVKIDVHEWNGTLVDRMKAHTTEKDKGAFMVSRLKEMFDLSDTDISQIIAKENEKIYQEQNTLIKPFSKERKPIVWKRDSRGNIA